MRTKFAQMSMNADNEQMNATVENRSGYHHGGLPEMLLALATEHIAEYGTEKLSLRALAREAGVSPTAPYRHFPTKRCLLAALATQGFERLGERMREVVESDLNVEDRFVALGVTYIEFALENPVAYQLMFGSIIGDFSEYDMLHKAAGATYAEVQRMLQMVIDEKELDVGVEVLSGVVWAGVHGLASLLLTRMDKPSSGSAPMESLAQLSADRTAAVRLMYANMIGD